MKKIIPLTIICIITILYFGFVFQPQKFPLEKVIIIDNKLSLNEIGIYLKETHIIKSPLLFKIFTHNKTIKAGEYYFTKPQNLFGIISRLREGKSGVPTVRITIPEGSDNEQIAAIIWGKLPSFDAPLFLKKSKTSQGFLFPDTYILPMTADENFVISFLRNTFEKKVGKIDPQLVNMAAILEEEGSNMENRKMIADILWRRLRIGMALQVDVARETYKWKGLTSSPITNPGLESIQAAQVPTKNPYLYYISDKDGIFHYAKTYDEHLVNIQKYLKK